ncbi:Yip1 family protein [Methylocystis sp. 9N]|uniref:Yip1 family protein n=1 Tax=Methylocystis borbori TaxID=3118750 RepID=A0ABU7XFC9_9HYPH
MSLLSRIKGLILTPQTEWTTIESEDTSILDLYRRYIAILALIPPFASFLSSWLFGFSYGSSGIVHATFGGGLLRAVTQYLLSLPALFLVAFVISMIAPYFEGKSDDRRALLLTAYSYTPAWLASAFGLIPGLRWLDVLGFYGIYVFSVGLPRMMRVPKENLDVFTLITLFLVVATVALHGWIVHLIAPAQLV